MKTHIYELAGVMLKVDYTTAPDSIHCFHSIHVMDINYKAVGPDLCGMLHQTLVVMTPFVGGEKLDVSTFLAVIAEELP